MIPPVRSMPPAGGATRPPMQPAANAPRPGSTPDVAAPGGVSPQVIALRKILGGDPNTPAPEVKVIAAMEGKLGEQAKGLAMAVAASPNAPGAAPAEPPAEAPKPNGPSGASMFGGSDSPIDDANDDDEDDQPTSGAEIFGGK